MSKRPAEHMKPNSRTCPHCGGPTVNYRPPFHATIHLRCPVCRCRWLPNGKHVVAGPQCPLRQTMALSA